MSTKQQDTKSQAHDLHQYATQREGEAMDGRTRAKLSQSLAYLNRSKSHDFQKSLQVALVDLRRLADRMGIDFGFAIIASEALYQLEKSHGVKRAQRRS
jgi:hypothetical protein